MTSIRFGGIPEIQENLAKAIYHSRQFHGFEFAPNRKSPAPYTADESLDLYLKDKAAFNDSKKHLEIGRALLESVVLDSEFGKFMKDWNKYLDKKIQVRFFPKSPSEGFELKTVETTLRDALNPEKDTLGPLIKDRKKQQGFFMDILTSIETGWFRSNTFNEKACESFKQNYVRPIFLSYVDLLPEEYRKKIEAKLK